MKEITVKHYNIEMYVTEDGIDFGTHTFKYKLEKEELLNKTFVTLPRVQIVDTLDWELGRKSLGWFNGLYKKLEEAVMAIQH